MLLCFKPHNNQDLCFYNFCALPIDYYRILSKSHFLLGLYFKELKRKFKTNLKLANFYSLFFSLNFTSTIATMKIDAIITTSIV